MVKTKAILNGKLYDTEKSKLFYIFSYRSDDYIDYRFYVYMTKNGNIFAYDENSNKLIAEDSIKEFLEGKCSDEFVDIYIKIFGEIEEA